jgi:hypothetical protein
VGKEKACQIVCDFFNYFKETISEEKVMEFAEVMKDFSMYEIQQGLEQSGKNGHVEKPEEVVDNASKIARVLNKITHESGIETGSCNKSCPNYKKPNHFCIRYHLDK